MTIKYEEVTSLSDGSVSLQRTNEDGSISLIPMVEENSDYKAYLDKDKAALSTPIVSGDE